MVERVKVTVRASEAHPDVMTVQDARRQVLDLFDLLSGEAGDDKPQAWHLVSAITNSPFTAEGEAITLIPDVDLAMIARSQKLALRKDSSAVHIGKNSLGSFKGKRSGNWI